MLSGSWGGRGPQGAAGSRAKAVEGGGGPQGREESRACWGGGGVRAVEPKVQWAESE